MLNSTQIVEIKALIEEAIDARLAALAPKKKAQPSEPVCAAPPVADTVDRTPAPKAEEPKAAPAKVDKPKKARKSAKPKK